MHPAMLLTDHRPDGGRGRTAAAGPAVPAGLSGGAEKMALILPTLLKPEQIAITRGGKAEMGHNGSHRDMVRAVSPTWGCRGAC